MKNVKLFYLFFTAAIILILAFSYQGCSQFDTEAVMAPTIGVHPEGWADTLHQDTSVFNGKYIYENKLWNLSACKTCQASDYSGGSKRVNCL